MAFIKKLLIIISSFYLMLLSVSSAPAPWGFAINVEKRECGNFWPGDEYVIYDLQEGWEYYASYKKIEDTTTSGGTGIAFETVAGKCKLEDENAYSRNDFTECCRNLGLSVVEVPKDRSDGPAANLKTAAQASSTILITIVLCCLVFLVILAGVIFIKIRNRKKQ